jgi:hypothetical protein
MLGAAMSLDREQRRGEQARRLLEEPLLVEAFATVEQGLRRQWEASGPGEEAARERLWLMLKLLGRVQGLLTETLETGRLAEAQLAAAEGAPKQTEILPLKGAIHD